MKYRQEVVFTTDDGQKFFDKTEALKHELLLEADKHTNVGDITRMLFSSSSKQYDKACRIISKLHELKSHSESQLILDEKA